jgi:putative membrane protein
MKDLVPIFPHLLAFFNISTVVLLILGVVAIKNENLIKHKRFMLAAVVVAVLFLIVYTLYHMEVGNVAFAGEGKIRWFYFGLLIAHVVGAVFILVMVPRTLFRALKTNFVAHKSLAKKTLPLWLFVSASGFLVYLMAFHIWPSKPATEIVQLLVGS